MRVSKVRILSAAVIFLSFVHPVASLKADDRVHVFRAISLELPIENLSLVNGNELVDLSIPSHRRSKSFKIRSAGVLQFVARGSVVPEAGPVGIPSLLELELARGFTNPLYIFYPGGDPVNEPYGVFPIEDAPGRFRGGESLFVNLSPFPMVLLLGDRGDERIQLEPRQTHSHLFKENNVNVRLRIATYAADSVQKGMDTRIFPAKSHRDVYFIYSVTGKDEGMVRMRLLREHEKTALRAYQNAFEK